MQSLFSTEHVKKNKPTTATTTTTDEEVKKILIWRKCFRDCSLRLMKSPCFKALFISPLLEEILTRTWMSFVLSQDVD